MIEWGKNRWDDLYKNNTFELHTIVAIILEYIFFVDLKSEHKGVGPNKENKTNKKGWSK